MPGGTRMNIREEHTLDAGTRAEQQHTIIEAIEKLEQQHNEGSMTDHVYFEKKRSLIRML